MTGVVESGQAHADEWDVELLQHPYRHFFVSEAWAAISSAAILILGWTLAYAVQSVRVYLPIEHADPLDFAEITFTWMTSISSLASFFIITFYQLSVLVSVIRRGMLR